MFMSLRSLFVVGSIVLLWGGLGDLVSAQRFPYEAPKAPEFDSRGQYVEPETETSYPAVRQSTTRPDPPRSPRVQRAPRPYTPEPAPPQSQPAVAAAPPPPPVPEEPPDCSQYPGMMSMARSQEELQWNARLYLTCLLKRGWMQDQARQEVIRVMESLRASRQ
ncbi:MAG: hypothetical protein AB1733_04010 [Thermodesulfobacteriota bacterium]